MAARGHGRRGNYHGNRNQDNNRQNQFGHGRNGPQRNNNGRQQQDRGDTTQQVSYPSYAAAAANNRGGKHNHQNNRQNNNNHRNNNSTGNTSNGNKNGSTANANQNNRAASTQESDEIRVVLPPRAINDPDTPSPELLAAQQLASSASSTLLTTTTTTESTTNTSVESSTVKDAPRQPAGRRLEFTRNNKRPTYDPPPASSESAKRMKASLAAPERIVSSATQTEPMDDTESSADTGPVVDIPVTSSSPYIPPGFENEALSMRLISKAIQISPRLLNTALGAGVAVMAQKKAEEQKQQQERVQSQINQIVTELGVTSSSNNPTGVWTQPPAPTPIPVTQEQPVQNCGGLDKATLEMIKQSLATILTSSQAQQAAASGMVAPPSASAPYRPPQFIQRQAFAQQQQNPFFRRGPVPQLHSFPTDHATLTQQRLQAVLLGLPDPSLSCQFAGASARGGTLRPPPAHAYNSLSIPTATDADCSIMGAMNPGLRAFPTMCPPGGALVYFKGNCAEILALPTLSPRRCSCRNPRCIRHKPFYVLDAETIARQKKAHSYMAFAEKKDAREVVRRLGGRGCHIRLLDEPELDDTKIYVANLPPTVTEAELSHVLSGIGVVASVKILRDSNGLNRGVGFVRMSTEEQAVEAIQFLHDRELIAWETPLQARLAYKYSKKVQMERAFKSLEGAANNAVAGFVPQVAAGFQQQLNQAQANLFAANRLHQPVITPQVFQQILESALPAAFANNNNNNNNNINNVAMSGATQESSQREQVGQNATSTGERRDEDYECAYPTINQAMGRNNGPYRGSGGRPNGF